MWIRIDGWDGWRWRGWDNGGGGEGETGKAGIKEVASHANPRLRAGRAAHVAELQFFLFFFFFLTFSHSNFTVDTKVSYALASLLTSAATGRIGLHQNLIKFYYSVKRFATTAWIILADPGTVAQFRFVIKKSLNVIKAAWQQGMKQHLDDL